MNKRVKTILMILMISAPLLYGIHRVYGPIQDSSGRWTADRLFYSVADDTNNVVALETLSDLTNFVTSTSNETTVIADGSGGVVIGIDDPLIVAKGGTGIATLTDGGLLLGSGTSAVTSLGVATNGQIPIGDGATDPVLATLTGTTNQVNVTNGSGSITLATPQDIATTSSPTFAGLTVGADANYVTWDVNGVMVRYGGAQTWKGLDLAPGRVKLPGDNPPAEAIIDGFPLHRFDRGTEESVYFAWTIPYDFAVGDASIRVHFSFVVANPPSGGGNENVRMGFETKKVSGGAVFDFSSGTTSGYVDEPIVDGETAYIVHFSGEGTLTTTGWDEYDTVLFRFYRDATDANDTYDNEASAADNDMWVDSYHLEYFTDTLGETE